MSCIAFHPTASNVLASAAYDNLVKLWDIETQQEVLNKLSSSLYFYSFTDSIILLLSFSENQHRIAHRRAFPPGL